MYALELIARPETAMIAAGPHGDLSAGQLGADVATLAEQLAPARFLINRCEDRYWFAASFLAAALRGQITLLPGQRTDEAADALRRDHRDTREIADHEQARDQHVALVAGGNGSARAGALASDQIVARAFTSGSTGAPQAHDKPWGLLCQGRATHGELLALPGAELGLVATVPSWHMYGFEWALLLATAHPVTLWCGPSFFPQDVARATAQLAQSTPATVLVTTPVHLRALLKSLPDALPLHRVVSATAPLDPEQAKTLEARHRAEVLEIYGCSEIGSLASRRTASDAHWSFFPEFAVQREGERLHVQASALPGPVTLADRFAPTPGNRYELLGRTADLVKIGGKRESLSRLNRELCALPGVVDGVFYDPEQLGLPGTGRLGALVVAPQSTVSELKSALAGRIDPVFQPRPLTLVQALPRTGTSKLPRAALRQAVIDSVGGAPVGA
ncbi:MAG: AMP-binding protein [Pseudomonadota bacterium]